MNFLKVAKSDKKSARDYINGEAEGGEEKEGKRSARDYMNRDEKEEKEEKEEKKGKRSARDYMNREDESEDNEKEASGVLKSAKDFLKAGMLPPQFNENTDAVPAGGAVTAVAYMQQPPRMFSRPIAYFDNSQPSLDGMRR